jgi:hypothetical protein
LVRRANEGLATETTNVADDLARLFSTLICAANDAHISLEAAARRNVEKVLGRWPVKRVRTPLFNDGEDDDERLPRRLVVTFREKKVLDVNYVFQSVSASTTLAKWPCQRQVRERAQCAAGAATERLSAERAL